MNSRKTIALLLLIFLVVTSLKAHSNTQNDPNWSVNPSGFQFSMTIVAYVRVDNLVSSDENDKIGVFVGSELRGTGNLSVLVGSTSTRVAFIQVYSNSASGENLSFKIYDASEDEVIDAVSTETFADGKKLGENLDPFEVTDNALASEITLSITSIDENQTEGSVTVTLGNDDPDAGQTYTYELVSGEGDDDNDDFSISGNQLTLNVAYDYESKTSSSFRLKVIDSKNGSFEQAFELEINDQNDAPTAISLSTNTLDENQSSGFEIGVFSSTDQDDGDTHSYELVSGSGDSDNDQFTINNSGKLLAATSFDFEARSSFSIRVKSTDSGGAAVEGAFTVTINDVNDSPNAIELATSAINENSGSILVTTLSATDQDAGDSHTFILVTGSGSDNNSRFTIRNGNELYATESFDFEVKSSYSIRLKAQDTESGTFEQSFTIIINDVNDKPSDISISNASVNENENVGVTVGSLSGTDQDAGETLTFSLVSGDGDEGNDYLEVKNSNELITKSTFNFEKVDEYSIRLKVTDSKGASFEKVLSIDVLNVNDAPTAISLSSTSISENSGANVSIGTLNATDEDGQDTHRFTLVSGTGADDNSVFEIVSGELKAKVNFNYEEKASYSIRLKVTDAGSLSHESVQVINVLNVNEAPTGLSLSNSTLGENQGADAFIATLTASDPDAGSTFTFELANGAGSENNSSFSISNSNELRAVSDFDFETKSSYNIRLEVSDGGGLSFEKQLTISVTDRNDAPTDLALSAATVVENASGSVIGAFSATDQDASDTHTFRLVEGDGDDSNSFFTINSNGQLVTKTGLNFEEASTHSVRVIVTDGAGASLQKVFTISVTDANDAPTNISIDNVSLAENLGAGHEVGTFSITDEDASDSHTLSFVSGEGSDDNDLFTISDGKLLTAVDLDFEEQLVFKIRVKAEDGAGSTYESTFSINVENVNDAPGNLSLSKTYLDENLEVNAVIGTLSATDEDANETLVFSLVNGEGDTDNDQFDISDDNELLSKASLDYESKSNYSVRIRVTDNGGLYSEKVYSLTVIDRNDAPTGLSISASTVQENADGAIIGSFTATDQDVSDSHTYKLIEGEGDESNDLFSINSSGQLMTSSALNFESSASHSVRVNATDAVGTSFQKVFTVTVTDENDAPSAIKLSASTVLENLTAGVEVGSILVTDEDATDTHTLSFVTGTGDTDNASFEISGTKLLAQNSFDYETQNSYSVRLKAVDGQGESVESILIINVLNDNDEPSAISLSANKINENSSTDTAIGSLQVTDQDANASYVYSLVAGQGDTDNASFGITNNQLVNKAVFDHEQKSVYSVRIKATENGGNSIEGIFTIQVEDVNEEPTAISLSGNAIPENSAGGTLIGKLNIDDPDEGDTYDYVLKTGVIDNLSFGINGGDQLVVAGELNFEVKNSYTVSVTAIDQSGNRYEKSFDISITNVAEPGIAPSVTEIDFGLTDIGRGGSSQTFEVLNDGPDGILEITDFELPGGITVTPELATVNPGETMTFTLKFDPEQEGAFEDELKIISNAGEPVIAIRGQAQLVAGLEDLPNMSNRVIAYPNPAKDLLFIDATAFGNKPFSFQFIDMASGKFVLNRENITSNEIEINTSGFSSGLYIIELFNNDMVARKKVMIVR